LIPVLSSAQARAFDAFLGEHGAMPSLLLMENAGRAAASRLHERLARGARPGAPGARRVAIVCGPGNNGGDGYVVARQLARRGWRVRVLATGPREALAPDAQVNAGIWQALGGELALLPDGEGELRAALASEWAESGLIVDALLGTGLRRPLAGRERAIVESINGSGLDVVALDVPSGLNADTGAVMGVAVTALETITFGHPKTGLLTSGAPDHTGELSIADLGVPQRLGPALAPRASWLEASDVRSWLEPRARSTHKGRSGRVLVIGGAPGRTGAAVLAASAALRGGAGLVTICSFADAVGSLDARVVEVMTRPIERGAPERSLDAALENADAVVIGPGLGLDADARRVVDHVVFNYAGPMVLDADALTLFAGRAGELARARGACLLTPHPAELGRLIEASAAQVEADRYGALERALATTGRAVLLKGPHTLVGEPGAPPIVVSEGHPALAVGGSGDVLSGLCGASIARLGPLRAGALAAFLHGRAARAWVRAHGGADRGLFARELADHVPAAIAELLGV
jgi:ADP-dependent NAD(P)H-hydrate dehydratase / NAD(P)H-hydrate epimerase